MSELEMLFSHVCGQQHCWVLGGHTLPFCQRCTGLYVGASSAIALILALRPRPGALFYWLHGFFMLLMFPFGFHLVRQGPLTRTFTGALFSFGLVYYLALIPFGWWRVWATKQVWKTLSYFVLIAAAIALLLWAVHSGGAMAAYLLVGLGSAGFAGFLLLTLANIFVLPRTIRVLRGRSDGSLQ